MKRDLSVVVAVMALAGAGAGNAADKAELDPAPALLAEAVRGGAVDADAAAALTRWILSEKDDVVARGLIHALRSAVLTSAGPEGERWDPTARAMAALFESALDQAAARRPGDAAQREALAAVMGAAAPAIAEALREADPAARETLMRFMQVMAPQAAPALPALRQALRHERPEVRRGAAIALGAMGGAARRATGDLRRALEDPDRGVSAAAADALRRVEGNPPAAPLN